MLYLIYKNVRRQYTGTNTYEQILLEMLERIKTLENKVERLERGVEEPSFPVFKKRKKMGLGESAKEYIKKCKLEAKERGLTEIVLLCNDIQKALGVINRTPSICSAMYDMMEVGDKVLFAPPSGKSTTVKVKYYIK